MSRLFAIFDFRFWIGPDLAAESHEKTHNRWATANGRESRREFLTTDDWISRMSEAERVGELLPEGFGGRGKAGKDVTERWGQENGKRGSLNREIIEIPSFARPTASERERESGERGVFTGGN